MTEYNGNDDQSNTPQTVDGEFELVASPLDDTPNDAPANGDMPKIDKPRFNPKQRDMIKFLARRSSHFLPSKDSPTEFLFTNWIPQSNYKISAVGNVRPIISAVNKSLQELGLIGKYENNEIQKGSVKDLHDKILEKMEARKGEDIPALLDKYSTENKTELAHFRSSIQELRQHVEDTYGYPDPASGKMSGSKKSTKYFGLTLNQRKELIRYLTSMDDMGKGLQEGSKGQVAHDIQRVLNNLDAKNYDVDDIKNTISGLSKAHELTNRAFIEATGRWPEMAQGLPDGSKAQRELATKQVQKMTEKQIDAGFYPDQHFQGKPVKYAALAEGENIEFLWQNELIEKYSARDENGNLKRQWGEGTSDPDVFQFTSALTDAYKGYFPHMAIDALEELHDLFQPWNNKWKIDSLKDQRTMPKADQMEFRLKSDDLYQEGSDFKRFTDKITAIASKPPVGRQHDKKKFGLYALFEEQNRPNRHEARMRTYRIQSLVEFQGLSRLSKPGDIVEKEVTFYGPLRKMGQFFTGAQSVERPKKAFLGGHLRDYTAKHTVVRHDPERETVGAELRRTLIRAGSLSTIDDIGGVKGGIGIPFRIPLWKNKEGERKYIPLDRIRIKFSPTGKMALAALGITAALSGGIPDVNYGDIFKADQNQAPHTQQIEQKNTSGAFNDKVLQQHDMDNINTNPEIQKLLKEKNETLQDHDMNQILNNPEIKDDVDESKAARKLRPIESASISVPHTLQNGDYSDKVLHDFEHASYAVTSPKITYDKSFDDYDVSVEHDIA